MPDDKTLQQLLDIKAGKLKMIRGDERVDLAAAAARAPDGIPKFTAVKKSDVDDFEAKLDIKGIRDDNEFLKRGFEGSIKRVMEALAADPRVAGTQAGISGARAAAALRPSFPDTSMSLEVPLYFASDAVSETTPLRRLQLGAAFAHAIDATPLDEMTPEARKAAREIAATLDPLPPVDQARAILALGFDVLGDTPEAWAVIVHAAEMILAKMVNGDVVVGSELAQVVGKVSQIEPMRSKKTQRLFERAVRAGGRKGARLALATIRRAEAALRVEAAKGKVFEAEQHGIRSEMARAKIDGLTRDIENVKEKSAHIKLWIAACEDIEAMCAAPALGRLSETCYHKCVESWRTGKTILPRAGAPADILTILDGAPQIFLVQHDWAAAFQNATDFDEGDFRLPYQECIFEFRIAGRRTCAGIASDGNGMPEHCLFHVETKVGWALAAVYAISQGQWIAATDSKDMTAPLLNLIRDQVRAISIALEAKVATSEVVRAPYRLNQKREKSGKLPIFDYHAVSLARRVRILPREVQPGETGERHRSPRLHFVRGHFRHYENHKTWINWFLRGDPDLGFVDKDYRL
jgi:hypothetical protein